MIYTANRACSLLYQIIKNHKKGIYLIPANVCPIVPLTLRLAEIDFEFVDIDRNTLCIDEVICKQKIINGLNYVGVIFVRTYGYIYDTTSFFSELHLLHKDIIVIDDRCLCLPSIKDDLGNADYLLYSTGYGKQINIGYGGFCLTNNILNPIDKINYTGFDIEIYYKEKIATNSKIKEIPRGWLNLDDINTSSVQYFRDLAIKKKKVIRHKNRLNDIYKHELLGVEHLDDAFQNWRYNIIVPSEEIKKEILTNLFSKECFASSHYSPVNKLFDDDDYVVAQNLSVSVINLFNDFYYTENQALLTVKIINNLLR